MFLLLSAGLLPAAAADDDRARPTARVTHGPSCQPGGLVVEVVAGTVPYAVRLATTRTPGGEDEAQLAPGQTVVLRTDDVAWGERIDGRVEFTAADGSGTTFVDELKEYSFTRPTREDCAAVARPTTPDPVPPTTSTPTAVPSTGRSAGPGATSSARPSGTAGSPAAPTSGTASRTPTPTSTPRTSAPAPADRPSGSAARPVSPGETVTLSAGGFLPGERVTVRLREGGDVLGAATAGDDGSVSAQVRIPDGAAAGRTTVDLVGDESAVVADVELQVAGVQRVVATDGWRDLVPLTAAAVALVGSVSGFVSVAGDRRAARRHARTRSA